MNFAALGPDSAAPWPEDSSMQAKGDLEARSALGLAYRVILSIKLVQIPGQASAGVTIVSTRGKVVQFTPGTRSIIVEDPNGINVELYKGVENVSTKSERAKGN